MICYRCNASVSDEPSYLDWEACKVSATSPAEFIEEVAGHLCPLALSLSSFHPCLLKYCSMHCCNLGLLFTSNGSSLATLLELKYFGDGSLPEQVAAAWNDFVLWKKQHRVRCSQTRFTVKMIFKKRHGGDMSTKAFCARVIAEWVQDISMHAWMGTTPPNRVFGQYLLAHPSHRTEDPRLVHQAAATMLGLV